MNQPVRIFLIALCIFGMGYAAATPARAGMPPLLACNEAGHEAEQAGALPENLLLSIGLVESGRLDPVSGRLAPWPWTVNVDGAGHYFDNERDAAAFAQAASSYARDIDIGCFQISLENHPDAFASIDAAFNPEGNANFAARFLNELKRHTGSWQTAIADYHSALPAFGLPYQHLVLTAWQRLGGGPYGMPPAPFVVPDASVILESPAARLVAVITPDGATAQPSRSFLPRVITP